MPSGSGNNTNNRETLPVRIEVSWNAEVKKIWGPKFNAPELAYEFSNGRKFELRTGDAAIYASSPDF